MKVELAEENPSVLRQIGYRNCTDTDDPGAGPSPVSPGKQQVTFSATLSTDKVY